MGRRFSLRRAVRLVAATVGVLGAAQVCAGAVLAVSSDRTAWIAAGIVAAAVGLAHLAIGAVLLLLSQRISGPAAPVWAPGRQANGQAIGAANPGSTTRGTSAASAASATWALVDQMRAEAKRPEPRDQD